MFSQVVVTPRPIYTRDPHIASSFPVVSRRGRTKHLVELGRVLLKLSNFVLLSTTSNVRIKSIWRLIGGLEQLE
jgi:hypothetical protein